MFKVSASLQRMTISAPRGTLADLQNNLSDIAVRYNKDIIVVETAYPFTSDENDGLKNIIAFQITRGYPATPEGQTRMLADVMNIVRASLFDTQLKIVRDRSH